MLLHVSAVQALEFVEGKQYQVLKQQRSVTPKITEYFSFYCPHCYMFEQVIEPVKKQLPSEVEFEKNHVSFMGADMGKPMAKAYATMLVLHIEDKMIPIMFDKIQKLQQAPNSDNELRQIFIEQGIDADKFDKTFNSVDVNIMQKYFDQAFQNAGLNGVPSVIVNNRYLITPDHSIRSIDDYITLVNHLLSK